MSGPDAGDPDRSPDRERPAGPEEEAGDRPSPEAAAGEAGEDLPAVRADLSLGTVRRLLSGIPGFVRLVSRLMRDRRVSRFDRILFALTLAYLFVPFDIVPDWLLGLGQLDDLVIVGLALNRLVYRVPEEVLLEHWEGDVTPLLLLRDLLDRIVRALPRWLRPLLRSG